MSVVVIFDPDFKQLSKYQADDGKLFKELYYELFTLYPLAGFGNGIVKVKASL